MRPKGYVWRHLPVGPATVDELCEWPANACQKLKSAKPEALQILANNIRLGGTLITHDSGKGTGEAVLADIARFMCKAEPGLSGCSQPRFRSASACDIMPLCRDVLMQHPADSGPLHIFGDMLDRVAVQSPPLSERSPAEVHSFLKQNFCSLYTADTTAFCFRHLKPCRVWDALSAPGQAQSRPDLLIEMAGFSCTDFSPRRMGVAPKMNGKTAPVFHHWTSELKALQADVIFWENSAAFEPELLTEELGPKYAHCYTVLSPELLGWPVMRPRYFGVAVLRKTCSFSGDAKEFLALFERQVAPQVCLPTAFSWLRSPRLTR